MPTQVEWRKDTLRQRFAACLLMLHEARLRIEDTHPAAVWLELAWAEAIVRAPPDRQRGGDDDRRQRRARYPCPTCGRTFSNAGMVNHGRKCRTSHG